MTMHLNPIGKTEGDYVQIQKAALSFLPVDELTDEKIEYIAKQVMTKETYMAWGYRQGYKDCQGWFQAAFYLGAGCVVLTALRAIAQHKMRHSLVAISRRHAMAYTAIGGSLVIGSYLPGWRMKVLQQQVEEQMAAKYDEIRGKDENLSHLQTFLATYLEIADAKALVDRLKVGE